ncbi:hypothetical protein GCM10007874_50060 [Labrys miyagiensis]|uniref:Uncharacterized protein n=1 Tax=Labrys miyagiensis TaxID=346912 RepID=A0ABQ6CTD1_9HYPH|nr:hypothetical protein GCM10007874_50060 [Labrys miyagiensis]
MTKDACPSAVSAERLIARRAKEPSSNRLEDGSDREPSPCAARAPKKLRSDKVEAGGRRLGDMVKCGLKPGFE